MGTCAEKCATEYNISREDQDKYATESYRRAREAMELGVFDNDIAPIEGPKKRGKSDDPPKMISIDEEPNSVNLEKASFLESCV
mmetsp:Transcript_21737/g.27893  ORF Transcript_21737/g.27893 Transcript_21737/m.27893 type:complete len:84 (+) Transcript_21737:47-298(+)